MVNHMYYQRFTTPGLWRNKWRPILFCLILDDFGIEYVIERHAHHLYDLFKEHYDITKNWKVDMYSGINLTWDYGKHTFRISMDNYNANLIIKFVHLALLKPQHSPYQNTLI